MTFQNLDKEKMKEALVTAIHRYEVILMWAAKGFDFCTTSDVTEEERKEYHEAVAQIEEVISFQKLMT